MQAQSPKFQQYRLNEQKVIKCPIGNTIEACCIQNACYRPSLHCSIEDCETCHGMHAFCKKVPLNKLYKFLHNNFQQQRPVFDKLNQLQQNLISMIRKAHDKIYSQMALSSLPKQIKTPLFDIFYKESFNHFQGMDINQLLSQMQMFKRLDKTQAIQNLKQRYVMIIDQCIKQQEKLLFNVQGDCKIYSKILKDEEQIKFVFQSLQNPTRLELLYRGSQNQFSAAKFHQKCDGIPRTITVILTQFNQIIAGYTSLPWSSPHNWVAFPDPEKQSFLLQISKKQKIPLQQKQYAIYCLQSHGPRFGRTDLQLPNKCHQNSCIGKFPGSYNVIGKYKNQQSSFHFLTGAIKNHQFRVIQYEVFKIIS